MTKDERRVSLAVGRRRYAQLVDRRSKGLFLDEFCAARGMDRKHAIKQLAKRRVAPLRRGAPRRFSAESRRLLSRLWKLSGRLCGKLLAPVLGVYLESLQRREPLDGAAPEEVLRMSASTIDRALRHAKPRGAASRRRSDSLSEHRREVPLKLDAWPAGAGQEPGWLEADTVAHCGGDMSGNFAWSLTLTDLASQWTEVRSVWNKGAEGVCRQLAEMLARTPVEPRAINTDNGGEFLNKHVARYFSEQIPGVARSRSRSGVKNDNAHVEQKNGAFVRKLFGYGRIDAPAAVVAMSAVAADASLMRNLYYPTCRLLSKRREGGCWIKRYENPPRTPAQRILRDPGTSQERKERVRRLLAENDPLDLRDRVEAGLAGLARTLSDAQAQAVRGDATRPEKAASRPQRPQGPQRPLEPF